MEKQITLSLRDYEELLGKIKEMEDALSKGKIKSQTYSEFLGSERICGDNILYFDNGVEYMTENEVIEELAKELSDLRSENKLKEGLRSVLVEQKMSQMGCWEFRAWKKMYSKNN